MGSCLLRANLVTNDRALVAFDRFELAFFLARDFFLIALLLVCFSLLLCDLDFLELFRLDDFLLVALLLRDWPDLLLALALLYPEPVN